MYRCEVCGKVSQPREKMYKIVVEKRLRRYSEGTIGWEIVKEFNVCHKCKE